MVRFSGASPVRHGCLRIGGRRARQHQAGGARQIPDPAAPTSVQTSSQRQLIQSFHQSVVVPAERAPLSRSRRARHAGLRGLAGVCTAGQPSILARCFPANVALGQWARWRTRSACSREQRELSHSLSVSSWEAAQVHSCAPTGRRSEAPVTVLSREVEWHWMDTTQRALRLHAYARAVLTY